MSVRTVALIAFLAVAACSGTANKAPPPEPEPVARNEDTPPGISTECLEQATEVYVACTAECKTAPDPFNCCGGCDTDFATEFQNCCNEVCEVDEPPDDCFDDSGPGCAGGVIRPDAERPAHCD